MCASAVAPELDGHVWLERPGGQHRLRGMCINGNHWCTVVVVGTALLLARNRLHHLC